MPYRPEELQLSDQHEQSGDKDEKYYVCVHAKCNVKGQVSVDTLFKIMRNTQTKNIETKRM